MNSEKLRHMLIDKHGGIKQFARAADLNYQTLYTAVQNDSRLDNMNVSMFIKVAHGLDMSPDWLIWELGGARHDPQ